MSGSRLVVVGSLVTMAAVPLLWVDVWIGLGAFVIGVAVFVAGRLNLT